MPARWWRLDGRLNLQRLKATGPVADEGLSGCSPCNQGGASARIDDKEQS
jgi:hypothetical protein